MVKRLLWWQIATVSILAFAYCWPFYKCERVAATARGFAKNTCYYNGETYTVGIVIDTAQGVRCECATTAPDGMPVWVSAAWT